MTSRCGRSIATVCLSGHARGQARRRRGAGFDGVEIFEPDLIASPLAPAEVATAAPDLGLDRPLPAVPRLRLDRPDALRPQPAPRRAQVRRHGALGADTVLVCSNVSPEPLDDPDRLRRPAARWPSGARRRAASGSPTRRWPGAGTCRDWDRAWRIVRRADHPTLGICLDSFHILSAARTRPDSPTSPARRSSSSSWPTRRSWTWTCSSGAATTAASPARAASTWRASSGTSSRRLRGPLSLEVFNDVFRQADPRAWPSTRCVRCCARGTTGDDARSAAPDLSGYAFTELAVDGGLRPAGRRRPGALGFGTPASTAPSRSSCGSRARAGAAQRLRRPAGGRRASPRSPRSRWRAPTRAARPARRAVLGARAAARRGAGRGRPLRGRRAGRHAVFFARTGPGRLAGADFLRPVRPGHGGRDHRASTTWR